MALSQDVKTTPPLLPPATEPNSITSRTNASQPDLAPTPPWHMLHLAPPCPLRGAPHTYFPRCVPWADGAQLAAPAPPPPLEPLRTFTQMEAKGFPWCALHYHPQPKRWAEPTNLETPHDIWNSLPLTWIDIGAATRLIVFFLEQSWKSLKGQ